MKINVNKKAVGGRIKQIRLNKGYTLEAFGKLFNAKKGNVQSWEKGNALPNKERLLNISKIANLTVNELLYGSVDEFIQENYKNIVENSHNDFGTYFFESIDINDFFNFVKDKKLDKQLLNDIDLLINEFWKIVLSYPFNKSVLIELNDKRFLISERLSIILQAYKFLENIQERYENNEYIKNSITSLNKVIQILLEDKQESNRIL